MSDTSSTSMVAIVAIVAIVALILFLGRQKPSEPWTIRRQRDGSLRSIETADGIFVISEN